MVTKLKTDRINLNPLSEYFRISGEIFNDLLLYQCLFSLLLLSHNCLWREVAKSDSIMGNSFSSCTRLNKSGNKNVNKDKLFKIYDSVDIQEGNEPMKDKDESYPCFDIPANNESIEDDDEFYPQDWEVMDSKEEVSNGRTRPSSRSNFSCRS